MQHSPNLSTSLFLTYDPKSPDVIGEHQLNMSRDSTSLKKYSGDCLKLAKQRYGILSEMMLFRNYCIFSGSTEALVRCGGKL